MKSNIFSYEIPRELVAQEPAEPRDSSRLMVVDRRECRGELEDRFEHDRFFNLPNWLREGDVLVFNDSKVIKSRIRYTRGLEDELVLLLLRNLEGGLWEVLIEQGQVKRGEVLSNIGTIRSNGEVVGSKGQVITTIELLPSFNMEDFGETPLPPYIHGYKGDPNRYQTIYSKIQGSSAAPTAGLHFTKELLTRLEDRGVELAFVTLHVSVDTYMPVMEENLEDHKIHKELVKITKEAAETINNRTGRLITVGTTSTRVLENTYRRYGYIKACEDWADIYILPGFKFHVDGIITNFHYPSSTNIAMIAAFVGTDLLKDAYEEAISKKYRLFSFGDACLFL